MIQAPDIPLWVALIVASLVVTGALITFIGSVGLLRLKEFQQRMHAPTLGSTVGAGCILLGSAVCFTALQGRPTLHELLIALFLTLTTPVSFMLLARAAMYRDQLAEGSKPE